MADKFGLNREDFESYKEYRKAYKKLFARSEVGKLTTSKYNKSDKAKLVHLKYRQKNKGFCNAKSAKERAIRFQRLPIYADLKAIEQIYIDCPNGKQVDHIYALKGKNVSGLHVHNNLQYLTPEENRAKGNKHVS